jgi:hypothetical protein
MSLSASWPVCIQLRGLSLRAHRYVQHGYGSPAASSRSLRRWVNEIDGDVHYRPSRGYREAMMAPTSAMKRGITGYPTLVGYGLCRSKSGKLAPSMTSLAAVVSTMWSSTTASWAAGLNVQVLC